ncbi:hypothetical protein M595_0227 [Lyngbya aestuarii BL J]|uniref:Uncharacterized protein n=1 Tax=Lyngbya aestuarii BL J TaxID=1348334 RepID=U7QPM8_9CYAN|nr:hypothetical protein M595_0227 [Lyngbya aestuarii BL J]
MNDFVTCQWSVLKLFSLGRSGRGMEIETTVDSFIGFWENSHRKNCFYFNSDWQVCLVVSEEF